MPDFDCYLYICPTQAKSKSRSEGDRAPRDDHVDKTTHGSNYY